MFALITECGSSEFFLSRFQYGLYVCPPWFREDWLNLYEESCASDHRFVYLGPAGANLRTCIHFLVKADTCICLRHRCFRINLEAQLLYKHIRSRE